MASYTDPPEAANRDSPDIDLKKYGYVYPQLPTADSIRLVSFAKPLDYDSPILQLSMKTVDLNTKPVYDALSYTWGNPLSVFRTQDERSVAEEKAEKQQPVICDGRVMYIRQNLLDFLHAWKQMLKAASNLDDERVKQAKEANLLPPTELWIDALSINQEDIDEKSTQVNMMGRIYSATRKVIIWLGPEDYFTRPALQLIMKMQNIGQMQARDVRQLADDDAAETLGLPPLTSSVWWSLFAFLHRAWFRRVWVMQELAFAPYVQLHCGLLTFTWSSITKACAILFESRMGEAMDLWAWMELTGPAFDEPLFLEDLTPILTPRERPSSERNLFTTLNEITSGKSYQNVIRLEAARVGDGSRLERSETGFRLGTNSSDLIPSIPILHMFDASRRFEATDPRDKVYGILSLAKRDAHDSEFVSPNRRPVAPNYYLEAEEVFLEAAWYTMLSGNDLEILMRTYIVEGGEGMKMKKLPSWVPDWNTTHAETPMWSLAPYRNSRWSASRESIWNAPEESRLYKDCLPVQGILVDTLIEVVTSDSFSLSKSGEIAAKLPPSYPWAREDVTPDEVLWRTLIANHDDTHYPATPEFTQISYNSWIEESKKVTREYHTKEGLADKEKEDEYYRFIHQLQSLFPQGDCLSEKYWGSQEEDQINLKSARTEEAPPKDQPGRPMSSSDANRRRLAALRPFSVEDGNKTIEAKKRVEEQALLPKYQESQPVLSQVERMMKDIRQKIGMPPSPTLESLEDRSQEKESSPTPGSNGVGEDNDPPKPLKMRPGPSRLSREFDRLKSEFTIHRRVFRTNKNYLGNGPKHSRPGDEVWLLNGAKVPFVLRPQSNDKYLLVGDAYVHGIMHGEAFVDNSSECPFIELV